MGGNGGVIFGYVGNDSRRRGIIRKRLVCFLLLFGIYIFFFLRLLVLCL